MRRAALFAALSLVATPVFAAEPADTAAALRDRALTDTTAWTVLEDLTSTVGPRLVGSPGMARAKDWAVKTFTDLGFTNVKVEEFAKPSWARGAESASITGPYPFQLSIMGLGRTVPTPAKGIEAEVVVFKSYAALLAAPVGAVAFLMRSVSTSDSRLPHTGVLGYAEDAPKIPAAALGVPDADLIERLAKRGPVRIKLSLASTTDPKGVAWNISGEIAGSSKPEEVIVIGGHLDSWDPGTGAIDDASGVAITTAAAKLIGDLPKHPRRTIRVVMWGSEESGGSSEAYLAAHKDEVPGIVMASESDLGADSIFSLMLPKDAMKDPALAELPTVLGSLNIFISRDPAPFGGSDVEGLQAAGVPVFTLRQSALRYFDLHHSGDDTIDKVDPAQLNENVAAWAALLYMLAQSEADYRAAPTAAAPKAP